MQQLLVGTLEEDHEAIGREFEHRLRVVARQAVSVWFIRDRLDSLLASYIGVLDRCELLYAIDSGGRQVSSNIEADSINVAAYGQDLSNRPYSVSLRVLQDPRKSGAFACRRYTSQITLQPCVTVMYAVTAGSSLLGYIAADIRVPGE